MRYCRWLLIALLLLVTVPIASAQTAQRCFRETNQCIAGRIRQFWEQNGGLIIFGFPTGPQGEIQIEGKRYQAQTFERSRLELHPQNKRPYDVLLGRLGADRLAQQGRDWQAFPKSVAVDGCRFFPETSHNVCSTLYRTFRRNGLELDGKKGKTYAESLALFGLPLSNEHAEIFADGTTRLVQWFERARLEYHPENLGTPYEVQLGLLGNELRDNARSSLE
jgi:polysaccharide biosynthesis protein PslG